MVELGVGVDEVAVTSATVVVLVREAAAIVKRINDRKKTTRAGVVAEIQRLRCQSARFWVEVLVDSKRVSCL